MEDRDRGGFRPASNEPMPMPDLPKGGLESTKGIIYVMTTAVEGLTAIGKVPTVVFEERMDELERNGYRNMSALRRKFAIETEDYAEKMENFQNAVRKSRVAETDLYAVDYVVAMAEMSRLDGKVVFPQDETKEEILREAEDVYEMRWIPNGVYRLFMERDKYSTLVYVMAYVHDGTWRITEKSRLGKTEKPGVSLKAKALRAGMPTDEYGYLKRDFNLGKISPNLAGMVVANMPVDGWESWKMVLDELEEDDYDAEKDLGMTLNEIRAKAKRK